MWSKVSHQVLTVFHFNKQKFVGDFKLSNSMTFWMRIFCFLFVKKNPENHILFLTTQVHTVFLFLNFLFTFAHKFRIIS